MELQHSAAEADNEHHHNSDMASEPESSETLQDGKGHG